MGLVVAAGVASLLFTGKPCPSCDDPPVREVLAGLCDNDRLLHAASVSGLHQLDDGLRGRRCTASVQWGDSSRSEVAYGFSRPGNSSRISTWVDVNGGMHGPTF